VGTKELSQAISFRFSDWLWMTWQPW